MKRNNHIFFGLTSLILLVSCTTGANTFSGHDSDKDSLDSTESVTSDFSVRHVSPTSKDTSADSAGSVTSETSSTSVNGPVSKDKLTIYSINDMHASVEPFNEIGDYEVGFARLKYAIEHDADYDPDTSLILCGGDVWQGGYLASQDKTMVAKAMNTFGIDAMVIGNHEFDWGPAVLSDLVSECQFPVLGCNIIDKDTSKRADFAAESTVLTTGSGLKVGVVGVIGAGEESDILASNIAGYEFSDSYSYVKSAIEGLPSVDFTFLLAHDSLSDSYVTDILDSLASDGKTINGVIGAHTHVMESDAYKTIPYIQAGCNTKAYAKMTYTASTKKNTYHGYNAMDYSDYSVPDSLLDQDLLKIINDSSDIYQPKAKLGISTSGYFDRRREMRRFSAEAGLYEASKQKIKDANPLIFIGNNGGIRNSLPSGDLTRENVAKALPFENKVAYHRNIPGSVIRNLTGKPSSNFDSQYYYFSTEDGSMPVATETYDVVSIDYCFEGGYFAKAGFPSASTWTVLTDETDNVVQTEMILDYLQSLVSNGTTVLKSSDYSY